MISQFSNIKSWTVDPRISRWAISKIRITPMRSQSLMIKFFIVTDCCSSTRPNFDSRKAGSNLLIVLQKELRCQLNQWFIVWYNYVKMSICKYFGHMKLSLFLCFNAISDDTNIYLVSWHWVIFRLETNMEALSRSACIIYHWKISIFKLCFAVNYLRRSNLNVAEATTTLAKSQQHCIEWRHCSWFT